MVYICCLTGTGLRASISNNLFLQFCRHPSGIFPKIAFIANDNITVAYRLKKGCSDAPIFDFEGWLVALLTPGSNDIKLPYIYGFRIGKLLESINLTYFNDKPASSPEINQQSLVS